MKKTIKIVRSIIASLLFLILIFFVATQSLITTIKLNSNNLQNLIDKDRLLKTIIEDDIENEDTKDLAIEYIDDYSNYVFHKRSIPSFQTVDFSSIDENNVDDAKKIIRQIDSKLDLKYDEVLILRESNNILSNGSIYLLVNVAIFLIFVLLFITLGNIKKSSLTFLGSISIGSLITLLASSLFHLKMSTIFSRSLYYFFDAIWSKTFIHNFNWLLISYFAISSIIIAIILIHQKYFNK